MATLLTATTFNGVKVCQASSNTNTITGNGAGISFGGTSVRNTIFGYKTSSQSTNSCDTTAMGNEALGGISGAPVDFCRTVAIGSCAMANSDSSNGNAALGFQTMQNLGVNSNGNVAVGSYAGKSLAANATHNTFIGFNAGYATSSGSRNTGVGWNALCAINNGNDNTGIGNLSLCALGNGNGNIAIGYKAGRSVVNASNTIAIGHNSTTSDTNGHTVAGNSSMTSFKVPVSWTTLSDRRDKSDIADLDANLGLNFVRRLRPVKFNFDFRDSYVKECGFPFGTKDGSLKQTIETYGFIAQEMEEVLSGIGTDFEALNYNNDEDRYRLIYEGLIAPIVKSLQQTISRLEILESKVS